MKVRIIQKNDGRFYVWLRPRWWPFWRELGSSRETVERACQYADAYCGRRREPRSERIVREFDL